MWARAKGIDGAMTPSAWASLIITFLMDQEEPVLPDLFYMAREIIKRNGSIEQTILYDKNRNKLNTT